MSSLSFSNNSDNNLFINGNGYVSMLVNNVDNVHDVLVDDRSTTDNADVVDSHRVDDDEGHGIDGCEDRLLNDINDYEPGVDMVSSLVKFFLLRRCLTQVLGFNQVLKPLIKLCEETNEMVKLIMKHVHEQTELMDKLFYPPRNLQNSTEQLSSVVHMV